MKKERVIEKYLERSEENKIGKYKKLNKKDYRENKWKADAKKSNIGMTGNPEGRSWIYRKENITKISLRQPSWNKRTLTDRKVTLRLRKNEHRKSSLKHILVKLLDFKTKDFKMQELREDGSHKPFLKTYWMRRYDRNCEEMEKLLQKED